MKLRVKIILYLFCCVCVLFSGCSEKSIEVSTNSDIVETVLDEATIIRNQKNDAYMSQNIAEKISAVKTVTEYPEDTLVDDMESVMFGRYCQENDKIKDYIDWLVLYRDDKEALLLSKYIIDNVSYSYNDNSATWDISNVRKWLNEDFYVNAFDDEEKSVIFFPILYNNPNTRWNIDGGTDTMDKVFLLSVDDVNKYFYKQDMYGENKKLATYPTNYAKNVDNYSNKLWVTDNKDKWFDGYCSYYLRTPGVSKTEVSVVNQYGYLNTFGAKCHSYNYGIRPAMWIKFE